MLVIVRVIVVGDQVGMTERGLMLGKNKWVVPRSTFRASPPLYQFYGMRRAVRWGQGAVTEAGDPITSWLETLHLAGR